MNGPQVRAGIRGHLAGCKLVAAVWNDAGSLCWQGQLAIEGKTLHELVQLGDTDALDPVLSALLYELVGPMPTTLDVSRIRGLFKCSLSFNALRFWSLRRGRSLAFALEIRKHQALHSSSSPELARLWKAIGALREALGSAELILAYRRGDLTLREISGSLAINSAPPLIGDADWLLVSKYSFGNSTAGKAIKQLFGGSGEFDLVAGYDLDAGQFAVCLAIPAIKTKYIEVAGLYIVMIVGGQTPRFEFRSDFLFPLREGETLRLSAASSFTPSSFLLSAEVELPQSFKIPLLDAVSLDNAAFLVGFSDAGLVFGFLASLHIRELLLFGALILDVKGNVPVPTLISGAIGQLSLPALYKGFTGRTLEGLDALEMIALGGLDFAFPQRFDVNLFEKRNTDAIVSFFNGQVKDAPALALRADEVQIRRHDKGYALVDRQRMRHYFVDSSGVISLRAQFYYAWSLGQRSLGSFSISPGFFFAGSIEVFDARFEALFSLRENEGLLAFARIDRIVIGDILRISSTERPTTRDPIDLPSNDLLRALVPAKNDGLVFYLSASRREVTFYFDGKVKLLDLFEIDARLIYASRQVSIHTAVDVFGVRATFALDASYENILAAKLGVRMSVDTKGLTAGLNAVTKRIDDAISAFAKVMNNAQASLAAAQERVDELRGEMAALDRRIKQCAKAIQNASTIKRPFVAIAKGAEIAAYEVAKAGIWTAMKVATAVLSLASKAATIFANVGEGILELVNATIRSASSLLFLRHVEIEADIDNDHQTFGVDIAFVALGQLYTYQKTVDLAVLQKGLLPFLRDKLLDCMHDDLENLKKGRTPERPLMFAERAPQEAESIPDIERASSTIDKVSELFGRMLARYRENFGDDLSDFNALRLSFLGALEVADHALTTASSAMPSTDPQSLKAVIDKKRDELSGDDLHVIDGALADVKNTADLHQHVDAASNALTNARKKIELPSESTRKDEALAFAAPLPISEEVFLEDLHADALRAFAEEPEAGYINLAKESKLTRYFDEALAALGKTTAPEREAPASIPSFGTQPSAEPPYRPRL